jgi:hypothetical protein
VSVPGFRVHKLQRLDNRRQITEVRCQMKPELRAVHCGCQKQLSSLRRAQSSRGRTFEPLNPEPLNLEGGEMLLRKVDVH